MKVLTVALVIGLLASFSASAAEPYGHNPALNPVKLKDAPKHEPFALIENGKLNFALAFDYAAESDKDLAKQRHSIRQAVQVLQEAIKKCANLDAPVIDANDEAACAKYKYLVLVGKSVLTDKLGINPLELPSQGFEVRTFPGGVAIVGNDGSIRPDGYDKLDRLVVQNGTCNGMHDFVERFFGARFYFPGPGVIWPKTETLTMQPVNYTDAPVFANRNYHTFRVKKSMDFGGTRKFDGDQEEQWPSSWSDYEEDWQKFAARWRLAYGSPFVVNHAPQPHSWLAAHPDKKDTIFYRDPSGALYYEPREHVGNYYDVSNLELADIYVGDCKRFYDTGWNEPWSNSGQVPNSKYVFFGQCDSFINNMSTPTIRELGLIPESRRGMRNGELSDVHSRFFIALAERIQKELPGKRLAILAYQNYNMPPVNPKYRKFPDIIDVHICPNDLPRNILNPERAAFWKEQLDDWREVLGGRPVSALWLYQPYTFPWGKAMVARHIGDIPKKFGESLGREALFFDLGELEWCYYPAYYACYRSMWNPDFNVQAAMEESWPLLYGKAAPFLKEFDDLLVDRWLKVFVKEGHLKSDLYQKAYPLTVLDKLEELLKKAEAALEPGSPEMLRFKLYSYPWPEAIKRMRGSVLFEKPIYKVKRLAAGETVNIDGKLDEKIWQSAEIIPLQDPFGSGEKRTGYTGRMVWNDEGMFLSFEMKGKPLADPAIGTFKNDNVEIFISPGTDLNNFFQFVVNAADATWTGSRTLKPVPTPYNGNWKCPGLRHAVDCREDGWSFELFVPFAGIEEKTPAPYSNWFLNVVGNKLSEPKEYSAYSLTQGNNHNVELFGYLHFLGMGD
jgi:hypothetical protein